MSNLKIKCFYCDRDATYFSDIDGLPIDTCIKHFKYLYTS